MQKSTAVGLFAVIGFLTATSAFGQTSAQLNGIVTDPSGASIPGARVTVTSLETGSERQATTDQNGTFTVPLLLAGNYRVHVEGDGFRGVTREPVVLEVNQTIRLDFALEVGAVAETIEVSGAPPPLDSDTSAIGQVIEERAVQDLPLNGRSFVQLAILAPGVTGAGYGPAGTIMGGSRPDDLRPGSELFTNGIRENANNWEIDGIDNNDRITLSISLRPSVEAIRQFKMETSNFKADQGRNAGATINVVTKNGTNELHGSLYEFLRNNKMDARNFFDRPGSTQPDYRQNQFGATAGGPIAKNKLFYFGAFEGFRKRRGTTEISTVPSAAMRGGDFSAVRDIFDPFSVRPAEGTPSGFTRDILPNRQIPQSMFDAVTPKLFYGVPLPDSPGLVNNLRTVPKQEQDWNQGMGRADWNVSDKGRVFGRYSYQETTTVQPSTFPAAEIPGIDRPVALGSERSFAGNSVFTAQNAAINYTHSFTPTVLFDGRLGFNRFKLNYTQEGAEEGAKLGEQLGVKNANQAGYSDGIPIFFPSGYQEIGQTRSLPIIRVQNAFTYKGNMTHIMGKHTIKYGFDTRRRQMTIIQNNQGAGRFNFNTNVTRDPNNVSNTGDGMASLIIGTPSVIQQDFALLTPGYRNWEHGFYFQDDWRATSKLTLNLGLRYELFTRLHEVANRISNFDIDSGQLLIAGFNTDKYTGIQPDNNNFAPRFGFAYQVDSKTVVRGGFGVFWNPTGTGGNIMRGHRQLPFGPVSTVDLNQFDPDYPRVQDGLPPIPSLDFEGNAENPTGSLFTNPPDIRASYVLQWNLQVQRALGKGFVTKVAYVANGGRNLDTTFNYNQPFPGPGGPAPRRPLRDIAPNVVNVTYLGTDGRSNYNSLQASLERRFAGGLGLLTSYTWSHAIDNVPNAFGGGANGPLPQDVRNRNGDFGNAGFDIRQRFIQTINWAPPVGQGRSFDLGKAGNALLGNWQTNFIVTMQEGLPFTPALNNSVSNAGGSRPDALHDARIDNPDPTHWFDTSLDSSGAAWGTPEQFTFGNGGRNIMEGPGRINFDFSVFRRFPINEDMSVQFRGEFFNLFNTPQFGLPGASIGNPSAGIISSTVGNPREIQFGLKFVF